VGWESHLSLPPRGVHARKRGRKPTAITTDSVGNLWFTEAGADFIARLDSDFVVTEFPIPTPPSQPFAITLGPDGNLWFTEPMAATIGRITPQGQITEFPLPSSFSRPAGIVGGPDGNVWFIDSLVPLGRGVMAGAGIGRITPNGTITEFEVPGRTPFFLTSGPDQNLWFAGSEYVGRATTLGTVTPFPVGDGRPIDIAAAPDGALWFTSMEAYDIGRLTPDGDLSTYSTDNRDLGPQLITLGPDDNMWYSAGAGGIYRVNGRHRADSEYARQAGARPHRRLRRRDMVH
jgi:virginiamycin B lyase